MSRDPVGELAQALIELRAAAENRCADSSAVAPALGPRALEMIGEARKILKNATARRTAGAMIPILAALATARVQGFPLVLGPPRPRYDKCGYCNAPMGERCRTEGGEKLKHIHKGRKVIQ